MRTRALAAAALAVGLMLTGCETDEGTVAAPETDASTQASSPADPAAEPADDTETEAPADPSGGVTFKDAVEYEDGLKVEIAKAQPAKASEYAAGAENTNGQMVIFTLRITNGGTEPFDTALVMLNASYGEAGDTAESVYDGEQDISLGLEGTILAGKSKSAKYAFAIPKKALGDVTLEVDVDPFGGKEPAIFTGPIK